MWKNCEFFYMVEMLLYMKCDEALFIYLKLSFKQHEHFYYHNNYVQIVHDLNIKSGLSYKVHISTSSYYNQGITRWIMFAINEIFNI